MSQTAHARALKDSWILALRQQRRSPRTIATYETAIRLYLDWCDATRTDPDFSTPHAMRQWLAGLADAKASGNTINSRLTALRSFAAWLVEEVEIVADGAAKLARASVDDYIPPAVLPAGRDALLRACSADRSFYGIRDGALISFMFDTMTRADETVSMRAKDDVVLRARTACVRRGKGARERWVPFSHDTARLLDRYQRRRGRELYGHVDAYWIGKRGPLTYKGLYIAYKRRAAQAGLEDETFPHALRAGGAAHWRRLGGSTESLMTVGGWRDPKMVLHYTKRVDLEIALAEGHRLFDQD